MCGEETHAGPLPPRTTAPAAPGASPARRARSLAISALLSAHASVGVLACANFPLPTRPPPRPVPASIEDPHPPDLQFVGSDLSDDSIVRLTTPHVACTGTLIAPKLVLTAHHCVAARDTFGEFMSSDVLPEEVVVELGGDYLPWAEVEVAHIVAPPCGHDAGFGDIALLVLSDELSDVTLREVRLDEPPKLGEELEPSGFGQCADSEAGVRRHLREGGKVERVDEASVRSQAAVCPGDSGGPGVDRSNRVVGVISSSAMDGKEHTRSLTEFTRVDRFRDVFANGVRLAAGDNPAELPPLTCDSP